MRFSKWHALGNAYVVVQQPDAGALTAARIRRLCDVDTGLGADGIVEVVETRGVTARVVIWNPDGSTAEMSGNGVRIAARWLADESNAETVTVTLGSRDVASRMLDGLVVESELGAVEVGEPELLEIDGGLEVTPASVGNPHAVVRLDAATREDLLRLGPALETHKRFPQRTNVQLVRVDARHELTVLVWERGAGETAASGSSSVAAAGVAVERGWAESPVTVHLPGGDLGVRLDGDRATLTGPVERICVGETDL
jgi:diaminopimelate epimerase